MTTTPTAFGAEALALLDQGMVFDLAVVDAQTSAADVHGLLTAIRQRRPAATLPLILLAPLGEDSARYASLQLTRLLHKPFKISTLLAAIEVLFSSPLTTGMGAAAPLDAGLGAALPLSVLVAEDHPTNQLVAQLLLNRLGYSCTTAANGLEAIDAIARQPIDVIFMDIQMPELDGMEATRRIVSLYPSRKRPWIIAMTANAMEGDREVCLKAGMDDYISKPISAHSLGKALALAHNGLVLRR
jgi:CheY-like chemotaxis protein